MEVKVNESLDALRIAFPPHELDAKRAFGAHGSTYLDTASFIDGARGKRWDELEPAFLEYHHDALGFFPPSSLAEYLPAYLAAALGRSAAIRNLPAFLRGVLTRTPDAAHFDERISALSSEQRTAIARALAAIESMETSDHMKADMAEVIDSYWREYL